MGSDSHFKTSRLLLCGLSIIGRPGRNPENNWEAFSVMWGRKDGGLEEDGTVTGGRADRFVE